jgi:perosamine synthetase
MLEHLILEQSESIKDALKLLNRSALGTCFIVKKSVLVGVLTDGDIRRSLLKGATLDTPVNELMQRDFVSLAFNTPEEEISNHLNTRVRIIPLIDELGKVVDYASLFRQHFIPVMEPSLSGNELKYVTECIRTNWISSQGHFVKDFETIFQGLTQMGGAVATSNGTCALHLAIAALGIGVGDEVIVPNLTFASTVNAIIYTGADPVLVDVDQNNLTIDIDSIESVITPRTRAIIPVHLYGHPCDMDPIIELARKHNLLIIEDCAEALGSLYKDKPVGSFGDAAIFSFFGNKTITTGEGGMGVFKDPVVEQKARILRDHGMNPEKRYWHNVVGYNYRLTNIQAAIGVAQMEQLPTFVERKREIAKLYQQQLCELPLIQCPIEESWAFNTFWLYTISLNGGSNREKIMANLKANGIDSRPVFYPIHVMPPYQKLKQAKDLSNSTAVAKSSMSLPSYSSLSNEDIERIGNVFKTIQTTIDLST